MSEVSPLTVATLARAWDFGRPPSGDGSYSGHGMSGSLESGPADDVAM